jgi:hypothetical protein
MKSTPHSSKGVDKEINALLKSLENVQNPSTP